MKDLINIIQEGVLSDVDTTVNNMDNDVLIAELSTDLACSNKNRFDKAVLKLYEILSKTGTRVKSKNKLEIDEYYIKFPPGMSDRYGHALVVFKHCETDHNVVSTDLDTVDYIFYRANGTSPWKFNYDEAWVKYNFRDNLIFKCPDNLKPVIQSIMTKLDPFKGWRTGIKF